MKCVAPALTFAVAAVALQGAPVEATTCKKISEDGTKFASFLRTTVGVEETVMQTLFKSFQPIDSIAPWLSTCVAAIDPMAVFTTAQLSSGYKACNTTITNFFSQMPDDFTDSTIRKTVCPFYGETVLPCANNVGMPIVLDAMAGTGTCCDGLKSQIKTWMGADLKTVIADVLNKVGAATCSVKTFKDSTGATMSEACLWSMWTTFMGEKSSNYWVQFAQLPNAQACKAMLGQSFVTTQNAVSQFKWAAQGVEPFGVCYEPLSQLFKTIGSYPVMKTPMKLGDVTLTMADAFSSSTGCLLVDNVLQWVKDKDSTPMRYAAVIEGLSSSLGLDETIAHYMGFTDSRQETLMTVLSRFMDDVRTEAPSMCIHVASGQKCDYGGATTTMAYKTSTTGGTSGNTSTTTTGTSAATGSLLLGVAIAIASGAAGFAMLSW